jgi:hypothetical protein
MPGTIYGTPQTAAIYTVTVQVVDNSTPQKLSSSLKTTLEIKSPVSCSGTNEVISGVNKFWLDVNGGLKNGGQSIVYTPTPGGTTFTGGTKTFIVGELIDYVGIVDGIGMCAANSMTVKPPAPTYSCTKPSGAKSVQAKGKITQIGAGYIVVDTTTVQTPTCTAVSWNGATGFAIGQRADFQGFRTTSGAIVTVAQKITIN